MMPAITHNTHYLFENGVLEFDRPVEIHVSRFSNNERIITPDAVSSYPKYKIPFSSKGAYKVYVNCNEPISSPNREKIEVVIANHEQYDLILTSDEEILRNCPNSVLFPYGTTWLNKGHINHPDGLGVYDESLDELCENKKYEVSFLGSAPRRDVEGYDIRRSLWSHQEHIKMPRKFYISTRNAWGLVGETLPEDDKKHLFESQFSIVIESSCVNNYFTEKLMDAFITKTVPIYWGCPNIGRFFDLRGMILIDSDGAIIGACNEYINEDTYENIRPHIEENYNRAKEFTRSFAVRVKEEIENAIRKEQELEELPERLLTIGICSLNERKELLDRILNFFKGQINTYGLVGKVEIMVNIDDGEKPVGQKRNEILNRANGKFIAFVDDDDGVDKEYLKLIIEAIEENEDLDCIGFSGMYYIDKNPKMIFKHANSYGGHFKDQSGIQHRPINHLNPVRLEIAKKIGFPEKNFGEDSDYCDKLFDSGLLKNEVILDTVMYHYYWANEVTRTH